MALYAIWREGDCFIFTRGHQAFTVFRMNEDCIVTTLPTLYLLYILFQADRARLELQNTDLTSKLIHLEKSVEQSAVLAVELEEAGKKVALLGEQLEEQQISTEK